MARAKEGLSDLSGPRRGPIRGHAAAGALAAETTSGGEQAAAEERRTTTEGEEGDASGGLSSPEAIVAAAASRRSRRLLTVSTSGGGGGGGGGGKTQVPEPAAVSPTVARRSGRFDVSKPAQPIRRNPADDGAGAGSKRGTATGLSSSSSSDDDGGETAAEKEAEKGWVSKGKSKPRGKPPRRRERAAAPASPSRRQASPPRRIGGGGLPPASSAAAATATGRRAGDAEAATPLMSTTLDDDFLSRGDYSREFPGAAGSAAYPAQHAAGAGRVGAAAAAVKGGLTPEKLSAALQRVGASPLGSRVEDADERIHDAQAFAQAAVRCASLCKWCTCGARALASLSLGPILISVGL